MNQGLGAMAMEDQGMEDPRMGGGMEPSMEPGMEGGGGIPPDVVEDVVQLLLQGATPQDLINGGIPPEVIEAAIAILEAQQQEAGLPQEMGPPPQEVMGQGLASQAF